MCVQKNYEKLYCHTQDMKQLVLLGTPIHSY